LENEKTKPEGDNNKLRKYFESWKTRKPNQKKRRQIGEQETQQKENQP